MKTMADVADDQANQSIEDALGELVEDFFNSSQPSDVPAEVDGTAKQFSTPVDPANAPPHVATSRSSASNLADVAVAGSINASNESTNVQESNVTPGDDVSKTSLTDPSHQIPPAIPTPPATDDKPEDAVKPGNLCSGTDEPVQSVHAQQPTNVGSAEVDVDEMTMDADRETIKSNLSDLSPDKRQGLNLSQLSTDESVLDNIGDEYSARRQIRLHQLEYYFQYPTRMLKTMMKAVGISNEVYKSSQWLRQLRNRFGKFTFSTAFSGIDTPNVALLLLCEAMDELDHHEQDRQDPAAFPKNVWACEISNACRSELLGSVNPPKCIFGNVQDFWQDVIRSKISNIRENHLVERVLLPLVKSGEAARANAYCHVCETVHDADEADLHVAGTTCTAFSRKGNHEMLDDITALDLFAWVAQRRRIQEN